jgi:hypothetical protein
VFGKWIVNYGEVIMNGLLAAGHKSAWFSEHLFTRHKHGHLDPDWATVLRIREGGAYFLK